MDCSVEGCDREKFARGFCKFHYQRWSVRGTTDDPIRPTPDQRFWQKVDQSGGCWLWTAGTTEWGYGSFWTGERRVKAHRWSYEHLVGPIPEGLTLDHLCRNPPCVNPAHLEPVTGAENTRRGGNALKTHCPQGHEYDAKNTRHCHGSRFCRACDAAAHRRAKERKSQAVI